VPCNTHSKLDVRSANTITLMYVYTTMQVTDFGMSRFIPRATTTAATTANSSDAAQQRERRSSSSVHSGSQHGASSSSSSTEQTGTTASGQVQPATAAAGGSSGSSNSGTGGNAADTTAAAAAAAPAAVKGSSATKNSSSSNTNDSNTKSNCSNSSDPHMTGNLGTVAWAAPEMFSSNASSTAVYSLPADVYSFGVVLWELWERSGKPFAQYSSRFDIIDAVLAAQRPAISSSCPRIYAALMRDCWQQQPQRRPTFAEVVKVLELELASAEAHERKISANSSSSASKRSSSSRIRSGGSSSSVALQLFDSSNWRPVQPSKQWASDDSV
jgi:Protein tyrosine and serine/threonine kinase